MTISFAGMSALIVDDDVECVRLLRGALEAHGLRITTANSVEEAKVAVETWRPDVIIAELALAGETGLDFVRWLRSRVQDSSISAIGMTLSHEQFSQEDAEAAGFSMVVRKPVNPMEVVVAIALLTRW